MIDFQEHDFGQLFGNNVLEWKGQLIYFTVYNRETNTFRAKRLTGDKHGEVIISQFNKDDFKYPNFRLGYVNFDEGAAYFQRIPVRQYKVGFCTNNVRALNYNERAVKFSFDSLECRMMFNKEYPSAEDAWNIAKQCGIVVAFEKQFAISPADVLIYRGSTIVGKYTQKKGPELFPEYSFLEGHMENLHG
jgi:hypothetical protein